MGGGEPMNGDGPGGGAGDRSGILENMKSSPTTAPTTPAQPPDPFFQGENVRMQFLRSRFGFLLINEK